MERSSHVLLIDIFSQVDIFPEFSNSDHFGEISIQKHQTQPFILRFSVMLWQGLTINNHEYEKLCRIAPRLDQISFLLLTWDLDVVFNSISLYLILENKN